MNFLTTSFFKLSCENAIESTLIMYIFLTINTFFLALLFYRQKKLFNSIIDIKRELNNGVLEQLYNILKEEITGLDDKTEQSKAIIRYFKQSVTITYENYKLLKQNKEEALSDGVLVALQDNQGQAEADVLGRFFDKQFVQYVKEINHRQLKDFFKKVQLLIARKAEWNEYIQAILYTYRINTRTVYDAYFRFGKTQYQENADTNENKHNINIEINNLPTNNSTISNIKVVGDDNVLLSDSDLKDVDIN